jgi:hypothetical protein
VNNILTVLNMLLKKAVEWEVLEEMPCTIRLLAVPKFSAVFFDFEEYERLVSATGHPRGRYRSWPDTRISTRRSATCT